MSRRWNCYSATLLFSLNFCSLLYAAFLSTSAQNRKRPCLCMITVSGTDHSLCTSAALQGVSKYTDHSMKQRLKSQITSHIRTHRFRQSTVKVFLILSIARNFKIIPNEHEEQDINTNPVQEAGRQWRVGNNPLNHTTVRYYDRGLCSLRILTSFSCLVFLR